MARPPDGKPTGLHQAHVTGRPTTRSASSRQVLAREMPLLMEYGALYEPSLSCQSPDLWRESLGGDFNDVFSVLQGNALPADDLHLIRRLRADLLSIDG